MSYRLSPDESVTEGLRRILREEIEFAIAQLAIRTPARRDEAIHEARKSVKKLRGVVRLVKDKAGNRALRDIGRSLSKFRDAAALVETVDALCKACAGDPRLKAVASVRRELVRRAKAAGHRKEKDAAAKQASGALGKFAEMAAGDLAKLSPGLRKTYREGRKALARARSNPTPENLHELRKRVKDHWYHVRLLEDLDPDRYQAREKPLNDMQEWLGDDHNLFLLDEAMASDPLSFPGRNEVSALIAARRGKLCEDALHLGKRLYE